MSFSLNCQQYNSAFMPKRLGNWCARCELTGAKSPPALGGSRFGTSAFTPSMFGGACAFLRLDYALPRGTAAVIAHPGPVLTL